MPLRYVCIRLPYRAGLPARNITYPRLPSPESLPSDNYDEDTTSLRQRGLLRFFTGFRHLFKCLCRFQTSICGAKCTFLHRSILYTLFAVLSSTRHDLCEPVTQHHHQSRSAYYLYKISDKERHNARGYCRSKFSSSRHYIPRSTESIAGSRTQYHSRRYRPCAGQPADKSI